MPFGMELLLGTLGSIAKPRRARKYAKYDDFQWLHHERHVKHVKSVPLEKAPIRDPWLDVGAAESRKPCKTRRFSMAKVRKARKTRTIRTSRHHHGRSGSPLAASGAPFWDPWLHLEAIKAPTSIPEGTEIQSFDSESSYDTSWNRY